MARRYDQPHSLFSSFDVILAIPVLFSFRYRILLLSGRRILLSKLPADGFLFHYRLTGTHQAKTRLSCRNGNENFFASFVPLRSRMTTIKLFLQFCSTFIKTIVYFFNNSVSLLCFLRD